jgi:hypothetical protein
MQQEIGMAVENYDDQIWNQLNAYLSDFGKNNGYRIVFSEFDRNILFHQQSLDKTGEAIEYVNARYRGE